MTILNACFADAARSAILISTVKDGDVFVQADIDSPYAIALAAWVAAGGVVAPYVAPPPLTPELTREAFCVALIGAGILTEAQASAAALGEWPAQFEPALTGKALVEKLTAKNTWRTIKTVPRDAPLFLDLLAYYAAAAGLNAVQAQALGDAIFAAPSV